ncbi:MAG TPA: sugar ABC transporter ATP-binding protein [Polyangiaceae bacterium]
MLSIRGLTKRFGATRALAGIDLCATAGEVMAVIGENGAGKSTLMKLLAGACAPDSGVIELAGHAYRPRHASDAQREGVALVPQEAQLVPHLSVAENIVLGRELTRRGFIDRREVARVAAAAIAQVTTPERPIDIAMSAGELGPSARQRVVIARALAQPQLRVLIFDEPTSSLTRTDTDQLFAVIRRLKERGLVILYVSHFLEEVLAIADRYTVLRDGKSVATGPLAQASVASLVSLMTGSAMTATERRVPSTRSKVLLESRGISGPRLPGPITFTLHAGEVLGIAGLVGSGRTRLLRSLFGLDGIDQGTLRIDETVVKPSPRVCLTLGLGLLSDDRQNEGLAEELGIAENVTLSRLPHRGPFVQQAAQRRATLTFVERLGIRCRDTDQPVWELSGGNQQKVALARLLHHEVMVYLLDEPTRGIDVRSRKDVHRLIDALAQKGNGVVLVSSYLPELIALSDRIAVMHRGQLGEARPTCDWTEHSLLLAATGAT